jgi:hypothetical protein
MESLLEKLERESPDELKSRSIESLTWFRQRVKTMKLSSEAFYKQSNLTKAKRYLEGRMYIMFYDAKTKDKLPYWDRFPLIFILELNQDGFTGLNLHYLPPRIRVRFLYELYKYEMMEPDDGDIVGSDINSMRHAELMRTKIRMTYQLLQGIKKLRYFKACYRRYLTNQIYGRPLEVTPDHWDAMAMLPLAQWQKKTSKEIYKESMEKING